MNDDQVKQVPGIEVSERAKAPSNDTHWVNASDADEDLSFEFDSQLDGDEPQDDDDDMHTADESPPRSLKEEPVDSRVLRRNLWN